jgi:hypothetical protein
MAFSVVGGGLSTYIPSTNDLATGALQVEFTRSVNTFSITRYAQLVPVTKEAGFYLRQDPTDAVRIPNLSEFAWAKGQDRPAGKQNSFDFVPYATARYNYGFYVPTETAQQAAWDTIAQHARTKMTQAMTGRTMRVASTLADSASWGSNYSATATAFGFGPWNAGTSARSIQKSIQKVMQQVQFSTGGAVRPSELIMVISPTVAQAIAQSAEVLEYVKSNPMSPAFLQGSDLYSQWGIPPKLFGIGDVVVEDAVRVSTKKKTDGSATSAYIMGSGAYFVSRPGGLVGVEGAPSFSTVQVFAYEDMVVEQWTDPKNRRIEGSVVDNSDVRVVAPVGGYAIADVLS